MASDRAGRLHIRMGGMHPGGEAAPRAVAVHAEFRREPRGFGAAFVARPLLEQRAGVDGASVFALDRADERGEQKIRLVAVHRACRAGVDLAAEHDAHRPHAAFLAL